MQGTAYLGIDAGSTTVKAVVIDQDGEILHSMLSAQFRQPGAD